MDNKIRGAAENNMPAYDEKTWQGMEALLNKHLPQKKKPRGLILFFILGAILVSGGVIMLAKFSSGNKDVTQQQNTAPAQTAGTQSNQPVDGSASTITAGKTVTAGQTSNPTGSNVNTTPATNSATTADRTTTATPASDQPQSSSTKAKSTIAKNNILNDRTATIQVIDAGVATNKNKTTTNPTGPVRRKNKPAATNTSPGMTGVVSGVSVSSQNPTSPVTDVTKGTAQDKNQVNEPVAKTPASTSSNNPAPVATAKNVTATPATTDKNITPVKNDSAVTTASSPSAPKKPTRSGKGNRFSLNFSAGGDLTSVGVDKIGKFKSEYGVGVGYAVTNRFTIRTGFYAGHKVYSADSTNYHTPYNSGPYSYRLSNIAANCLVYEIPVTLSYYFASPSKKYNWFVSGGLSSYLMKDEEYTYTYKASPSVPPVEYNHSFIMENKHFFSVLDLSGGYQYNVSKQFSLLAEPYLKLPLTGIGAGKVKLNSAGILFTVAIRPFAR